MKKVLVTLTDYVINIKSTVLSVTCNQYEINSTLSHNFFAASHVPSTSSKHSRIFWGDFFFQFERASSFKEL